MSLPPPFYFAADCDGKVRRWRSGVTGQESRDQTRRRPAWRIDCQAALLLNRSNPRVPATGK